MWGATHGWASPTNDQQPMDFTDFDTGPKGRDSSHIPNNTKVRSDEAKAAKKFAGMLDSLSFDPHVFAYAFSRMGTALQTRAFDVFMALLDYWADDHEHGSIAPADGQQYARQAKMSSRMRRAAYTVDKHEDHLLE